MYNNYTLIYNYNVQCIMYAMYNNNILILLIIIILRVCILRKSLLKIENVMLTHKKSERVA